jgi:hypothetical protein
LLELAEDFLQISGVFGNLRADGIVPVGPGGPAVSDMQQHDAGLRASLASCFTCSIMARSLGVPSSVTRIVLYIGYPESVADNHCHAVFNDSGNPHKSSR